MAELGLSGQFLEVLLGTGIVGFLILGLVDAIEDNLKGDRDQ